MLQKMRSRHAITFAAVLAVLAVASCKKEKKETYNDFMEGTLEFTPVNEYLAQDTQLSLVPFGLTNPDNTGYYWYSSWNTKKDTTRVEGGSGNGGYTVKVPHELGKYKLSCVAFAAGYYTSTAIAEFYVVSPEVNTTITDAELTKNSYKVTDGRDGRAYYATNSEPHWLKSNLGYSESGVSYKSSPAMDMVFGRYYTWNEAMTACPEGWRLPSDADFAALAAKVAGDGSEFKIHEDFKGVAGGFMVNASFLGERMWEFWPQVKITNKSELCAIPTGYCIDMAGSTRFVGTNEYAAFWTADDDEDNGFYRYFYVDKNDVLIGKGNKDSFRANVRCIKD